MKITIYAKTVTGEEEAIGSAISEEEAKKKVAQAKNDGYKDVRYEVIEEKTKPDEKVSSTVDKLLAEDDDEDEDDEDEDDEEDIEEAEEDEEEEDEDEDEEGEETKDELDDNDDLEERIDALDEAQEKLQEVVNLITEAVDGLSIEGNVSAYLIDHLKIAASSEHGFLSEDLNIDKVKEMVRKELSGEEYDEEEERGVRRR